MIVAADLPLLLASPLTAPEKEVHPIDRVRMQKAVFLLTMRDKGDWSKLYEYEPYNWGPYSSSLAADVNRLTADELIKVEAVPGSRYGRYRATLKSSEYAKAVWAELSPQDQSFLREVRSYVTSKSFSGLLREVYAAYPEYASKSHFSG